MLVNFRTSSGAVFSLDHKEKVFYQLHPNPRSGPLWNTPPVKIGKKVVISTRDEKAALRIIETGVVVEREVILDPK